MQTDHLHEKIGIHNKHLDKSKSATEYKWKLTVNRICGREIYQSISIAIFFLFSIAFSNTFSLFLLKSWKSGEKTHPFNKAIDEDLLFLDMSRHSLNCSGCSSIDTKKYIAFGLQMHSNFQ